MVGGSRPSGRVVILTGGGLGEKVAGFLGRARGESVVVAIARLMSAVCLLLVAVISARHLGPAGRGEIVFVLTVSMLGSEFVSLGANVSGRIQILRRSGVAVEDYLGLSVVLAFAQAALMALVFGTVGILVMDLSPMVCILGTLLGIAMFLAYMLVDAAFALRRTLETGVRDLLIGITPLAPVIAVAAVGRVSVAAVVGLTGLGYLIGGGYLWSVVYRRIGAVRFSRGAWGPILRSGLPVLGGSFGQTLAFRADRLILGVLATSAALGIFSVAATAAELPRLLLLPVTQILANRVAGGEITAASVGGLVARLMLGYATLMVVVGTAGASLVLPVVGEEFAAARDSIAVLAIGEALLGCYFVSVAVLTGLGRFRLLPVPAIGGAVVILVADILIVPDHGGLGAAWVRVAGFAIMGIAGVWSMLEVLRRKK